jgi:hypothetical protein
MRQDAPTDDQKPTHNPQLPARVSLVATVLASLPILAFAVLCFRTGNAESLVVFIICVIIASAVLAKSRHIPSAITALKGWPVCHSLIVGDAIVLLIPIMAVIMHIMAALAAPEAIFSGSPWETARLKESLIGQAHIVGLLIALALAVASPLIMRPLPLYRKLRRVLAFLLSVIVLYGIIDFGILCLLNAALPHKWADTYPVLSQVVLFPLLTPGYKVLFYAALLGLVAMLVPPFSVFVRCVFFYAHLSMRVVSASLRLSTNALLALSTRGSLPSDPSLVSIRALSGVDHPLGLRLESSGVATLAEALAEIRPERSGTHLTGTISSRLNPTDINRLERVVRDHERLIARQTLRDQMFQWYIPCVLFVVCMALVVLAFVPLVVSMQSRYDPQDISIRVYTPDVTSPVNESSRVWDIRIVERSRSTGVSNTLLSVSRAFVVPMMPSDQGNEMSFVVPIAIFVDPGTRPVRLVGFAARIVPDQGPEVDDQPLSRLEYLHPGCVQYLVARHEKAYPHFDIPDRPIIIHLTNGTASLRVTEPGAYRFHVILRLAQDTKRDWLGWLVPSVLKVKRHIEFSERKLISVRRQDRVVPANLKEGDWTFTITDSVRSGWWGELSYTWIPPGTGDFTDPTSFSGLSEVKTPMWLIQSGSGQPQDVVFTYKTSGALYVPMLLQLALWPLLLLLGRSVFMHAAGSRRHPAGAGRALRGPDGEGDRGHRA